MANRTADQLPATEPAPQEQRVIISCVTCNITVGTAWESKLDDVKVQLQKGKHRGHSLEVTSENDWYSNFSSEIQNLKNLKYYRQLVKENNGIYLYPSAS